MELPRHNITIRFKSNGVKEEAKDITFDNENEFLFNFVKEIFIDVKNFSYNWDTKRSIKYIPNGILISENK